jgi:malate dehydrogenase
LDCALLHARLKIRIHMQAYAAFKFAESCMEAMRGREVVECAYISSHLTPLPFFASPVRLGPNGVKEILPLPPMTAVEEAGFRKMQAELQVSIDKGVAFARS